MQDIITGKDQREQERQRIAGLNRIVNFTNIDTETFTHSFDGVPQTINAGATLPMQWIVADLYATHLARKMLNRERRHTLKPGDRKRVYTEEEVDTRKVTMIREIAPVESRDIIPPAEQIARRTAQVAAAITTPTPQKRQQAALDKQMIVEELERRGVRVDRRKSKEDLEAHLRSLEEERVPAAT